MRYHALAVDFDGTLAHDGRVDETTYAALDRLRKSGRKLLLVTGRRLEPLLELIHDMSLFDRVVAENGALVFDPETEEETLLAAPPPPEFAMALRERAITRLETGRCIVALWQPDQHAALEVIQAMGLELQIVFNKDAVMVLPSGTNKAAGLKKALDELGLSTWNTVAVGDAENDEAMMRSCGASAAVANAIDPVKQIADVVLSKARGQGVEELIDDLLETDLQYIEQQYPARLHPNQPLLTNIRSPHPRGVPIGTHLDGKPFTIAEYGQSLLVTGGPGGGKSKLAIGILERLSPRGAQCCIIDPEGDYQGVENSVTLGNAERAPSVEEVISLLERPGDHCTVSMFSIDKEDRAAYFDKLFHGLAELRSRTGRPHWIVVDEAHYAVPKGWKPAENWSDSKLQGMIFITAYHDKLSKVLLEHIDWIISIADEPQSAIQDICEVLGEPTPQLDSATVQQPHQALAWRRGSDRLVWFNRLPAQSDARRHAHSHYEGEMDEHLQFVFRGPESSLNLVTPNVKQFLSIAAGVDEKTWDFHRARNDYSRWFDDVIKHGDLAKEIQQLEGSTEVDALDNRNQILALIRERFDPKSHRTRNVVDCSAIKTF